MAAMYTPPKQVRSSRLQNSFAILERPFSLVALLWKRNAGSRQRCPLFVVSLVGPSRVFQQLSLSYWESFLLDFQ